jgi:hypothetical protein
LNATCKPPKAIFDWQRAVVVNNVDGTGQRSRQHAFNGGGDRSLCIVGCNDDSYVGHQRHSVGNRHVIKRRRNYSFAGFNLQYPATDWLLLKAI